MLEGSVEIIFWLFATDGLATSPFIQWSKADFEGSLMMEFGYDSSIAQLFNGPVCNVSKK